MNELPWFERHLDFGKPKEMLPYYLERLEGTIARLEKKVDGLPEELLSEKYNGKWSVKQNIGHLAEVDEIANKRLDEMTSRVETMSAAVFEPTRDYNAMLVNDVLKFFRLRRTENLEKYKTLSENELLLSSLHPRLHVKMTPVDLAWFDAEHDDHHLVKINEIISNLKKRK
jgi:hypothetical protein